MAQGFDRLLLGGALAVTGLLHRRLDQVDRRIADVERGSTAPVDLPAPAPAAVATPVAAPVAAPRPAPIGMPLPTGYGLQVSGPDGEDIVLPVCLPPGFELASLELAASFLPREARPAPARPVPPRAEPVPARVPETPSPAPRERSLEPLGAGLQLVYGDAGSYRASIEQSEQPATRPVADPLLAPLFERFESAL